MPEPPLYANKLLHSLSAETLQRLKPRLERVELRPKLVLHHSKLPIEQVYFVEAGLVAVTASTDQENQGVEGWIIGSEGLAGLPVVLGVTSSPLRRVVLVRGQAWAISSAALTDAMQVDAELRRVLLRYVHSVLVQTAQMGACNARHSLTGRLARWLLMADDRLGTSRMPLTHDLIAKMLGVRRASITTLLKEFMEQGLIGMEPRWITILDRPGLEQRTCYCYGVLRAEYHRDFGDQAAP